MSEMHRAGKEKKAGRVIILVAFVLVLCLSGVIWTMTEKYLDPVNSENRNLATPPVLSPETYRTFSGDYTTYFNDHLQFRSPLIKLNSAIDYFCFDKSSSEKVTIGRNGYLFYTWTLDGDPLGSYQGKDVYTEEQLQQVAANCLAQRDLLREEGREFVIYIAPNKERVYSENMPDRYGDPAENYRALQVYNYLKEHTDVQVIYSYEDLMQAKERVEENIWYKTDSHWNMVGAYVGSVPLLRTLGIDMPDIWDSSISIVHGNPTSGDLAQMLNMTDLLKPLDTEYTVVGYNAHSMEAITWDFFETFLFHATDADPRRLYVVRDSFSTAMAPYLGSQFTDSCFRHQASYTYEDLQAWNPDIVVYEVVERYVGNLMTFAIRPEPAG